jgi:hypothetical protein
MGRRVAPMSLRGSPTRPIPGGVSISTLKNESTLQL